MLDIDKTSEEFTEELNMMRLQVAELKAFKEKFLFTEKRQREKYETLRLFVEYAPASIAMFDRDMCYMAASQRWRRDYSLSEDGLIGLRHWDVFPDMSDRWKLVHQRGLNGETLIVDEAPFQLQDGSVKRLRWEIRPWSKVDGGIGGLVIFSQDITDRRQYEISLESNLTRLHSILSSLYGGCLLVTNEGFIEFANQAFCDMFYLEDAPRALVGLTAKQMIEKMSGAYSKPDEVKARILDVISRNEQVRSEEISMVRGKIYSVDFIPIVVDGRYYGRFWFHSDISERKQMEEAIRESEKKFSTAFWGSPVAVVIVSAVDGKFVEVNEVFIRDTGYAREEIIGRTIEEIGLYENYGDRERLLSEVRKHGHAYGVEITFLTKSGEKLFCSVSTNQVQLGGSPHFLTSILDVTRVKLALEALAEREERYRLVVATCPDAICITTLQDGLFVEINDAFTRLSGYTANDVMNKTTEEINLWAELEEREEMVRGLLEKGQHSIPRAVFRRKDGSLVFGSVSAVIMSHLNDLYVISITRDITDWVRVENEKHQLQAQLYESQKMESLATLAGGIAHDFNNMLQVIVGYCEILMYDLQVGRADTKSLTAILQTAETASDLVKKFMALGQQSMVTPEQIDLNDKIRELQSLILCLPNIDNLETNLVSQPVTIKQNSDQLGQIIMNLAMNASEAMPHGGKLSLTTANVMLGEDSIRSHIGVKPGPYVLFTVTDTGRGMDEVTLSRIFDPFFSTKERGNVKGMGLGLSVVRGIVQQRGGFITCESELGKGAIFSVYFPEIEIPCSSDMPVTTVVPPVSGRMVLVVEDSALVSGLEETALNASGYKTVLATNGKEAVNIYKERRDEVGLVVLDIIMPEMNGRDCLMELLKIDPLVKVIVLTGHDPNAELSQEVKPYVIGFLHKPCKMSQLVEVVQSVMEA